VSKYPVAVFNTHPIQYFAPLYEYIAKHSDIIDLTVYYYFDDGAQKSKDKGFQKEFQWDVPLLEGYKYKFMEHVFPSAKLNGPKWKCVIKSIVPELKLNKYKAAIIHSWDRPASWQVVHACKKLKIPTSVRSDNNIVIYQGEQNSFKKKIASQIRKHFFSKTTSLWYVGQKNLEFYKAHNVASEKLCYVPFAVDNERFINTDQSVHSIKIKQELGVPADYKIVLFTGKLISRKQPDLLLRSYNAMMAKRKDLRKTALVFVGDGPENVNLKKYIKRHSLEHAYITGFINQQRIPEYYSTADVLVLPSRSEAWGLSVNEAMCCKCAVIVSDNCGCADDLVKENGYIFKTDSMKDLTEKLILSLENDQHLNQMKAKSLEIINRHSFAVVQKNIENWLCGYYESQND
jgi:glycosyltransferase involved in cell wall biosynthesis